LRTSGAALDALAQHITTAKADLPTALRTGLDHQETRELLTTRDMERAVELVYKGLKTNMNLAALPA
jgi:hypothetical protein